MRLKQKTMVILTAFILILLGSISYVSATENTDSNIPLGCDNDIWLAWTIKDKNGKEVEGIRGGGDYGLQDMVIPGYNDYTNCYFELVINEYVGKTINLDNLGTFTYTNTQRNENDYTWYIYTLKISDTAKFNKPTDAIYFNPCLTVEKTGKTYSFWLDYKVVGERKVYKVDNDNVSISVNAGSEDELSLKIEEIAKNSDTYLEMIQYINEKCDNEYLGAFDISLVGGDTKGDLTITFSIDKKYNGKKVTICHKKANGTFEDFERTVENGKVTITVKELSPFMISLIKEEIKENVTEEPKQETSTNNSNKKDETPKAEKDETPKTGIQDITLVATAVIIISAVGIVATIKRKQAKH